ncbi:MAG: tetratricopeptide repeat protein [Chlamydiales bacterium]
MKSGHFLLISWLVLTAFSSGEQEKELRILHQTAEGAIRKKKFAEAKEAYSQLINQIGVHTSQKYNVTWSTYIDAILRFAETCEKLGEMEEGANALTKLLDCQPPIVHIPRIKLMHARLALGQKSSGEIFRQIKSVMEQASVKGWKKEDLTFFHALEYLLNAQYDKLMHKAKRFLVTGYHQEAIALYEEIDGAIQRGHYPKALSQNSLLPKKVRYQLAESYYQEALCSKEKISDQINQNKIYLATRLYQEKKAYQQALDSFENASESEREVYEEALFEIGYFYYQVGNEKEARRYFKRLRDSHTKPSLVAALYLAKIDLKEGKSENVEKFLAPFEKLIDGDPLSCEWYYQRAQAAYASCNYHLAKIFFKNSLVNRKLANDWDLDALFHLGWCEIYLANDAQEKISQILLLKAEKIFQYLLNTYQNKEGVALAMGRLYLTRWYQFHDADALMLIDDLLLPYETLEAFLIRAEAAQSYLTKEDLFQQATQEQFKPHPAYPDVWYKRGLNHLEEGIKKSPNHSFYFERAIEAFTHFFDCFENTHTLQTPGIVVSQPTHPNYHFSSSSLKDLQRLFGTFNTLSKEREEILYLGGLMTLSLSDFDKAKEALLAVIDKNGKYCENALYFLAQLYNRQHLYDQASETFANLGKIYPCSPLADRAWFHAAEAALKSGNQTDFQLRSQVYKNYPDTPRAAEAYFSQYSYETYLSGDSHALIHLKSFTTLFPHSPILVAVYYLIGVNANEPQEAKEAFEMAIQAFSLCLTDELPDTFFIYFRYQAMVDLAHIFLEENSASSLERAHHILKTCIEDFSNPHHFASLLMNQNLYPCIYQKGEYLLLQAYRKSGNTLGVQAQLTKMRDHFEQAGIKEGYYFSRMWHDQGEIAYTSHDFSTAIQCFHIAQECGTSDFSEEELFSLTIKKHTLSSQ